MSYFLAFAGFAALIVLHELGHFLAAKAVGMRVERFSLFFPPLVARVKRGETEYAIGAIPLGGYVRISGMNPYEELPPDVAPRAFFRQPPWKRMVVIAAGPVMNVLVAFVILFSLYAFRGPAQATDKVVEVTPHSAAAGALQKGDRLVAVDGVRGGPDRLRKQISSHKCLGVPAQGCRAEVPATLTVVRDGRTQTLNVRPTYDKQYKRVLVGFAFGSRHVHQGPIDASSSAVTGMWRVTKATVSAIGRLFYSEKARKEVSGVVGSYETTRQTINTFGFVDAMNVLAIISLSLAIVNLFPFLPLDGGHIFWAALEKLRRRPVPFSVMERASVIGFMLVIFIFAVGFSNDIGRLRGEGFTVR
jgi:regulator of sigma E protease